MLFSVWVLWVVGFASESFASFWCSCFVSPEYGGIWGCLNVFSLVFLGVLCVFELFRCKMHMRIVLLLVVKYDVCSK